MRGMNGWVGLHQRPDVPLRAQGARHERRPSRVERPPITMLLSARVASYEEANFMNFIVSKFCTPPPTRLRVLNTTYGYLVYSSRSTMTPTRSTMR